jgi:hypothetical protein
MKAILPDSLQRNNKQKVKKKRKSVQCLCVVIIRPVALLVKVQYFYAEQVVVFGFAWRLDWAEASFVRLRRIRKR